MKHSLRVVTAAVAASCLAFGAAADNAEGRKTAELLQSLIRIDTVNPAGDTRPVADLLKADFDAAGIANEIILAPNGKAAHFIARLKGDGSKRPVLIAAHTDVVPAEAERWTVPPFSGQEKDGYIYGRGALDNKGAVAAFARAVLKLKRDNVKLARDVIFLAEADEEQGQYNTTWLAANHWDKIDAEFCLNEGGRILWDGKTVHTFNVSTADKLTLNMRVKTKGPSGHSSRPPPVDETANGKLIAALYKLSRHETDIQLTEASRLYFASLAKNQDGDFAKGVARLLAASTQADLRSAARDIVANESQGTWGIEGLLRNTLVVTMFNAGVKANVIPGAAEAVMNARLMPGTDVMGFVASLNAVVDDPAVEIEIITNVPKDQIAQYYAARSRIGASPLTTDLYAAIQSSAKRAWPRINVVPVMLVASTDATPWRQRGIPVYGVAPFPILPEQAAGVHGDDERVAVKAVHEGAVFVFNLLKEIAAR